ncbi:tryptophan synthase beta chain 2 [Thermoclostridium stercorarium subsp. stercorarium DSM 8532]|uniref:tryptophan synthase n=3 Tax=Thermoclostridium stercorarium TaxID=1510 RepID=L7VLG7_THES1|nr:TrpB-like pyridoxal phosphate-dependent enzyme [Thermoclostridium stercorarium]AGC69030.1 tryptophan synthase beta chain 2 [Thermoclostridium stercorarium subsp. stercorarium DSM 8532]AGI40004.1 lyase [Thermoclostridium stercorarium subsp. stercorarium DSM 8532]ANW99323.1 TrpB-like pyridoxal-phosphate dependent enzyme [Thermoclostridium stercorarium subsp. thermolacticum DSM 2910]ANX01952.1 TrpB-like pyridoxal-phosphate dependent enzyme [Thermoclostridium stercorarium subsp. leptospartum DSM
MAGIPYKIYLSEKELPRHWYNLKAVMKELPPPMLNPATLKPCTKEDLTPIFCEKLVEQEFNTTDRYIEIPEGLMNFYRMIRPSPLIRAYNLERELNTPAEIYYKFEGTNTSGSHKLNSAAAQVYYAKEQGITTVTTETGAGQWGTALAMACAYYKVNLIVYMVKVSAEQKPYRKAVIETYGGKVVPSPSDTTEVGRKILAENPGTTGSLGCAISEAVETAVKTENCRYVLGSVLDHVLLHQSIIGLETKTACDKYGIEPDIIIGCVGGGSNFGGLIAPFMGEKIEGKNNIRFIGVEPASCPSFTRGRYAYDFGDTGKTTPLLKMYTLGSGFIPSPNHAGGLRYHGMSPILSKLYHDGYFEVRSVEQTKVFEAAVMFARCEGILPAPESSHALRVAIDEAIKCKETGEKKTIIFGLSGTGYFDMTAYMSYNAGAMTDYIPTDEDLEKGFATIPKVDL